ncbi:uncharacterized protein LOC131203182 [Ahaetulla prasina]|uniref:uncharacterized protein LOC131203182 n=1 Tax=Ahaetulla prasina TaxID=499056 RepID=UPI00264873CA|nr:uncharacterized protein LOC131203182 [Ahaetulla prasina]
MAMKYGKVKMEVPQEEGWRMMMLVKEIIEDARWKEFEVPYLWAEDNPPGFACHHPPIIVEEIPGKYPVRIRQRAYPRPIMQAVQKIIDFYLTHHILEPIESKWNTPILPISKGEGRFRLVQALQIVNNSTVTIHPAVPNPYVILGLIPPTARWFSVIDLKDAFFTIAIHEKSRHLFAFEWEDPVAGRKQQYAWTRLPQGFKNSPTLFGTALGKDLQRLQTPPPDVVLQYVDDLLVTGKTEDDCWQNTYELLRLLQECGYKASRKKAQLVSTGVRYLGYDIEQGKRTLGHERKEAICQLPSPKTKRELRGFLGAAGFCRIWIPNFSLIAKPLYEATRGSDKDPLIWGKQEEKSFTTLKDALLQAPSLGLPNLDKPFQLYVDTKQNVAVGVLTQKLGTWFRPIAYLSKNLDHVSRGWPTCLKAIAGTALLTQEANKLTFGQEIEIHTPHALKSILEAKGHLWLTNPRILRYQALITHNPMVKIIQSTALNPATLLPEPKLGTSHNCIHTIEETFASRPDLKDVPFPEPDYTLYTDGTSFYHEGIRKAGYAVVTLQDVWEAEPLPPGTSAQLAELHALTRALELSEGLCVNIYTDSKYAFMTVQVHGALYKERGLITAGGKGVKHGPQIRRLLESVWAPRKVAVIHCKGHQRGMSDTILGNNRADQEARHAADKPVSTETSLALWVPEEGVKPCYTSEESEQAQALEAIQEQGWWILPDQRVFVPQNLAWDTVQQVHRHLHLGKTALANALLREVYINKIHSIAANVCTRCQVCAANNPRQGPQPPRGHQPRGSYPFDSLMIDFTDMPRSGPYRAMLVIICTYTGWPECLPTRTKKASEVTRALLQIIIPRYGLPSRISSDNGPEFIHKATQKLATTLGITWKLHCSFHAESGGLVERANRFIKEKIAKICQETHLKWPDALNMALVAVRCTPQKGLRVSPFELLYGKHFIYSIAKLPNCPISNLPPCIHRGMYFWQCAYNATIKCHLLNTTWIPKHLEARKRARVPRQAPLKGQTVRCDSCIQGNAFLYNPILPKECNNKGTCQYDKRMYTTCLSGGITKCYNGSLIPRILPKHSLGGFTPTPPDNSPCPNNCTTCIKTVLRGNTITTTLIYHTHYRCEGKRTPCCYKGTWYTICDQKAECYDPRINPAQTWLIARAKGSSSGPVMAQTQILSTAHSGTLQFDICKIAYWPTSCGDLARHRSLTQNDIYICPYQWPSGYGIGKWDCSNTEELYCPYWKCAAWATFFQDQGKGTYLKISRVPTLSNCQKYQCNLVNITIPNPQAWISRYGNSMGIRLWASGTDPGGLIHLSFETRYHPTKNYTRYFSEFWKEVEIEFQPSQQARNLFLELASTIAHTLNVSSCYVCGGTKMGDQWPWVAQEWNYSNPYNMSAMPAHQPESRWELQTAIVARWCLASSNGTGPQVGNTSCLETQEWNQTTREWLHWPNQTINFWSNFSLDNITVAPPGVLEAGHWQGRKLKADFKIGGNQKWREDEWPAERIIQVYDPATWANDGMWGYQTPIYMLNRIIRLQAVVELIANETAQSLRTLAQQQRKFRDAIYQNRLALDYLLAAEGGVCAKFNFSNCCLEFDDVGEIIENNARRIEKIAHVPVHHWKGFEWGNLFGSWVPKLPGLQAIVALIGLIAAGCVILPCILPIFVRTISKSLSLLVDKRATEKVLVLWEYEQMTTSDIEPNEYETTL